MNNEKLSSLRSWKGKSVNQDVLTKMKQKSEKDVKDNKDKKQNKSKPKSKLLRIDSSSFVIRKINSFDEDYDVVGELGEGSFGKVYKVQHKTLKLLRALKKIKKSDPKSKFSNFQEIDVLKRLDHSNILKIYQFYETDEFYFIITDIFSGKQLFDEIVQSQKLTQEIAARVLHEILSTLHYSHTQNIAHRDIKPQNILIKNISSPKKMKIKIIDWGLGTLINNKGSNRVCGTPQYAAPEIFKGKYTLKCDMWSLGVLAFIMLTGNMPFKGKKTEQTIRMVQRGVINLRKSGFLELTSSAKDFITALIQKDPSKRLSAEQALNHPFINKYQNNQEVPSHLEETLHRLQQFNFSNRFGVAVINFMNNHYSSAQQKQKLDQIFKYLDKNGDGVLSKEQLIEGYSQIYGKSLGQKIAQQTFKKLDVNDSGTLQYSEFVAFGLQRHYQDQKSRLRQAFNMFDKDKNGCISWNQIAQVLNGRIQGIPEQKVRQLIKDFDENHDEQIDFEEFYKFITKIFESSKKK